MRILLTGGGTGGHIIPFEPIIETLRTYYGEQKNTLPQWLEPELLDIYFAGVVTAEMSEILNKYSVPATHIPTGKMRRYSSVQNISDIIFRLPFGIIRALFTVWNIMPDVIVSKGGYGSLPVVLAGVVYRIPILIHESDSVPGAANALLFRFASAITLGFSDTLQYIRRFADKAFFTGTPVRSQLRSITQPEAKKSFSIPVDEFVLLVFGGSQGAQQLNESLLKVLPKLIPDTAIIHITGPQHFEAIRTVAQELLAHSPRRHLYQPFNYLTGGMLRAIAAADAIVGRAGATTLSEIAAAKKPSLLIPLDGAAQDHQRKNAQVFEAAGAALVLDPTNMGMNLFEQNIRRLVTEPELRATIIRNLSVVDTPRAARDITEMTFNLAQGLRPKGKR